MSVVDASVVVDALVVSGPRSEAAEAVLGSQSIIEAPAIMKAEALSALRRYEAREELSSSAAREALDELSRLSVRAFPVDPFIDRIWELRTSVSPYDAWYVAIAEELDTVLLTTDQRLAAAPGPRCPIEVVGSE